MLHFPKRNRFEIDALAENENPLLCNLGSLFGSQPSGSTTTTTEPPKFQIPYIEQGLAGAQNLYENYTPQYYPGTQVAPMSDAQNTALTDIANQAATGEPITAAAQNFATNLDNGSYFNSNPASQTLQSYANGSMLNSNNSALQQAEDSTLSQVVPQIESQFISGGNLNSPEAAYATSQGAEAAIAPIAEQNYLQQQQNQLGAADTLGQNYQSTLQDMNQSLFTAPQTQGLSYNDANNLYSAGAEQQNLSQEDINAAMNEFNWQQQLPYQQLNQYLGETTGNEGSSTTTPYFENGAANLLSTGMGSGMLLNALGVGAQGAATPFAAASAGLSGAGSGLMSAIGAIGSFFGL